MVHLRCGTGQIGAGGFFGLIRQTAIVPPGLEKLPAFGPIEIARQFCSMAGFSGTNHQDESPGHGPDKTFRSPAPAAAVIPSSPASPG